jgi:hypothetical protein
MILLPYLIIVGVIGGTLFGAWCILSGRVNFTITDMTGDEPAWFRAAVFIGACQLVAWHVVQFYLTGGHWPGDDY